MSNGGDILSPMLPGNRNILFLMMVTLSHVIKNDTIFKSHHDNNMHCDPHYNVNCELWEFSDHMYKLQEFLINIRLALVFVESIYDITDFLHPHSTPSKLLENNCYTVNMYSSSLNNSASSPLPSPQELSHLRTEPDSLHSIAHKLTSQPTSTAIRRYYKLLSHSIAQLEEELESHKMEQEVVNNHLVDNRSVRNRIRLIINGYQQK